MCRIDEIVSKLTHLDRLLYYIGDRSLILTGKNTEAIPELEGDRLYPNIHDIYSKIDDIFKKASINEDDEKNLIEQMGRMKFCLSGSNITANETQKLLYTLTNEELNELETQVDRYLMIQKMLGKRRH